MNYITCYVTLIIKTFSLFIMTPTERLSVEIMKLNEIKRDHIIYIRFTRIMHLLAHTQIKCYYKYAIHIIKQVNYQLYLY